LLSGQNISRTKHDVKNLYQAFKENFKVLSNETIDETNARKTSTPFQKLSNENIAQILEYFVNKFRTLIAFKAILTPVRFSLQSSSTLLVQ
jgi:ribosome recycling factor